MEPDETAGRKKAREKIFGENEKLRAALDKVNREYQELKAVYKRQQRALGSECSRREEIVEALELAQTIIDKSPVILFRRLAGEDPRLEYVSENIRQIGYTAQEFLNGSIRFRDIVHPDDLERVGSEIRGYIDEDVEEYVQFYRVCKKSGEVRWVEDQTTVIRDDQGNMTHNQGIVVDITERKLAEIRLAKSEEKFRRIVETTGEGFIMMDENLVIIDLNDAYRRMLGYEREELLGKTPFDLATEDFRQFMAANKDRLLPLDYRKMEGKLVAKDGRTIPVLIHANTLKDDQGKMMGHVAFVVDLTDQKKALALAGQIQRSLIPDAAPRIEGFDIAGRSDACEEVGGDYFDFLFGPEYASNHLKVVVGDISGHGVDAALLMTSARAFMRMRAAQPGNPAQLVSSMNQHLSADMEDTGHFMTLFLMEIDSTNGSAHWVRAGHDPALIYHPDKDSFEELMGIGLPLGIDGAFSYDQYALSGIPEGTVIALTTDGVWESVNEKGEIFGKERLCHVIRQNADKDAQKIVDAVYDEIADFVEGFPRQDDITLVIIKTC